MPAYQETVTMATILVVDDERPIVEAIDYNLRREGYDTLRAFDAEECMSTARIQRPDLVILDVMLPSGSGFDVCKRLRSEHGNVPVVFLTARAAEEDRIAGFNSGGDDYVVKPFSMRELTARIKAMLRRSESSTQNFEPNASAKRPGGIVSSRGIELNLNRRSASVRGKDISLSRKEFDLLHMLIVNRGHVFDRQTILNRIWGEDCYVDERTVDVHVRWLREKIETAPSKPELILTVRGIGYKYDQPQE
jgi:two-component system OmpR family response regulator